MQQDPPEPQYELLQFMSRSCNSPWKITAADCGVRDSWKAFSALVPKLSRLASCNRSRASKGDNSDSRGTMHSAANSTIGGVGDATIDTPERIASTSFAGSWYLAP